MLRRLKNRVRYAIARSPILSRLYVRRAMRRQRLDEKQFRGRLQLAGHVLDLSMSNGRLPPISAIREFELLLVEMRERGFAVDEPALWAFSIYTAARHGLPLALEGEANPEGRDRASQDASCVFEGEFAEIVRKRRSVRGWTSDPVDLADIERVIDLAKWAPSSCNRQLWRAMIITHEDDKQFLRKYFNNVFWHKAPVLIVVMVESGIYGQHEKHFAYLDGASFIQTLLLALHARGYGACWVSFAKWDSLGNIHVPAEDYEEFYRYFAVEKNMIPVSMVALGRPIRQPIAPARQATDKIVIKRT